MLNQDQANAINFLNDFLESEEREALLLGSAGVGKSFTLFHWIRDYRIYSCLVAPTHKARKVLKDFGESPYIVNILTLHSQFRLRPSINQKTGEQVFGLTYRKYEAMKNPYSKSPAEQTVASLRYPENFNYIPERTRLCICDESSMVEDGICKIIRDLCKRMDLKILWVGDKYQLPPVQKIQRRFYSLPLASVSKSYQITTPVRNTGKIYEYCKKVRNYIEAGAEYPPAFDEFLIGSGWLKKAINQFKENLDTKIIAYTNKTVAKYNHDVREKLFNEDDAINLPFMIGEKLIFNYPYDLGEGIMANNSDEVEISDFDVFKGYLPFPIDYFANKYHKVDKFSDIEKESFTWFEIYTQLGKFYTLHPKDEKKWKTVMSNIAFKIKKEKNRNVRSNYWELFYRIKNIKGNLQYGYAITADKSQGSTYSNVFVDSKDILKSKELRRFYVAVSRAKEELYIK